MTHTIITLHPLQGAGDPYSAATVRFCEHLAHAGLAHLPLYRLSRFGIVIVQIPDNQATPFETAFGDFGTIEQPGRVIALPPYTSVGGGPTPLEEEERSTSYPWHIKAVRANMAWDRCEFGDGVRVAVLDTGIAHHPNLVVHGGVSFVEGVESYCDDDTHGTQCAGIIAATAQNNSGVVGIAPEAHLYSVKVIDREGNGRTIDVLRGMYWALENHMQIVSMSLAEDRPTWPQPWYTRAIEVLRNNGAVVVVGVGPSGLEIRAPANSPGAVAVGAVDEKYERLPYSAYASPDDCPREGSNPVTIVAPGIDIRTTSPDGFGCASGTSMSCAIVSGAVALVRGRFPNLTADEVIAKIKSSARQLSKTAPDAYLGYGLVDCDSALATQTERHAVSEFIHLSTRRSEMNVTLHSKTKEREDEGTIMVVHGEDKRIVATRFVDETDNVNVKVDPGEYHILTLNTRTGDFRRNSVRVEGESVAVNVQPAPLSDVHPIGNITVTIRVNGNVPTVPVTVEISPAPPAGQDKVQQTTNVAYWYDLPNGRYAVTATLTGYMPECGCVDLTHGGSKSIELNVTS